MENRRSENMRYMQIVMNENCHLIIQELKDSEILKIIVSGILTQNLRISLITTKFVP